MKRTIHAIAVFIAGFAARLLPDKIPLTFVGDGAVAEMAETISHRHLRRVLIVTDMTHGPRAALVARHFGLHPRVSAPPLKGGRKRTILRQMVRELGAYPLYAIRLKARGSERTD